MLASKIILVRPIGFGANPETRGSNAFQAQTASSPAAEAVMDEHKTLEFALREEGIVVDVLLPHRDDLPDAVFPNNWFSTNTRGELDIYPMAVASRQREVRAVFEEELKRLGYQVKKTRDWRNRAGSRALEGTGSLVIDPLGQHVYAARSTRTDELLVREWSEAHTLEPLLFTANDPNDQPIYHTNVIMGVGEKMAIACLECIPDANERTDLRAALCRNGRELIEIDHAQVAQFAGNALFLAGRRGETLFVSRRGWNSLDENQRKRICDRVVAIPVSVDAIESTGGGSVRCMIAENFLPRNRGTQGDING